MHRTVDSSFIETDFTAWPASLPAGLSFSHKQWQAACSNMTGSPSFALRIFSCVMRALTADILGPENGAPASAAVRAASHSQLWHPSYSSPDSSL